MNTKSECREEWVLRCDLSGYFKQWTGIGPECTQSVDEAWRFVSKQDAVLSKAASFPYTFFEPVRIDKE